MALDKEQQQLEGNLQVRAFLCTKFVSVKVVCTVVFKVSKGRNEMYVNAYVSLCLTFQMVSITAHDYNSMKITKLQPNKSKF